MTIIAGSTSATIDIETLDDGAFEDNESVIVTLSGTDNTNVSVDAAADTATVTIEDDDSASVTITANDPDADESGDAGQFTINLSSSTLVEIEVFFTVTGSAGDGTDFVSLPASITIPPLQTSGTIDITVIDDALLENNETVTITITGTNSPFFSVSPSSDSATVTIADNDSATVSVIASDPVAAEPTDDGQFTVTLSAISDTDTVVNYSISGTASSGDDFEALSGSVTIVAGQTSANVDLSVVEDTMLENTESVILTLTGTSDPDVTVDTSPGAGSATINIADDDTAQVSVVANEPSASEPGDVGQFTVSISETSDSDTVISYSISGDATPGTDFTALTGTVTIIAGQSSAVVDVNVLDDSILEDNESVTLTLTGTDDSDVTVDTSNDTAIVTIMDDDTALASIIANDLVADESGDTGQFIVTLSNASDRDTIVNYVVTGTAVDGDDFVSLAGSVTVLAGQTTATIDLTAIDDSIVEGGESVVVSLVSTDDADVGIDTGANTATVTIEDNDAAELTIASTSDASEPSTNGQFTVTLSAVSATDTVVNYIVGGDATAGDDYVALSGTITILAGATTGVIDVNAIDDTVIEDIESVSVTLDSVTAGDADITIGAANSAIVQITDNDSGVVNLLANIDSASEPVSYTHLTLPTIYSV